MKQIHQKNARVASFLRKALKPAFVACALARVFGPSHAEAQLYWNSPAGLWDNNPLNIVWSTDPAGLTPTPWMNLNPAVFGSTAVPAGVLVTVNDFVQPTSITFNTSGYDIEDGLVNGLTLTGNGNTTITLTQGVTATIGSQLNDTISTDTLTITQTGTGGTTLTLSGQNSGIVFTGNTVTIDGANALNRLTVIVNNTSLAGTPGQQVIPQFADLVVQNNATLDLNGFTQNGIPSISGNSTGIITNTAAAYVTLTVGTTSTGNLAVQDTSTFAGRLTDTSGSVETTLNPTPPGGLGLTVTSSATNNYTLILSGGVNANTYTGKTIVVGAVGGTTTATLQGGAANSFSENSVIDVQTRGIVDIHGFDQTVAALDGTGTGTITNLAPNTSNTLNFGGGLTTGTLTSNANINDGAGNGRIGLTKFGTYSQVLAGNNGYSGTTTVSQGTLAAGSTTAFSSKSAYTVTAILDLNGFNSSIGSLAGGGLVVNGSGNVTGPHGGNATLITGLDNTSTTYSGAINDGTSGKLAVTKSGNGTFTVTGGSSTYSGGTMLLSGGLYADTGSMTNTALTPLGTGTVTINSSTGSVVLGTHTGVALPNAISVLSNFQVASGTASVQDLVLAGSVDLNGATRTITGITSTGQVHFSGSIGSSTGVGGVTFIGTAPYTAFIYDGSAANTYTGLTTVGQNAFLVLQKTNVDGAVIGDVLVTGNGSVDYLGVSNQIANTSNVTVNSAGLDAGGIHFQGFELRNNSDTIGNLFGTGTVGLGSGTLTVSGGNFSGNILDGQFGRGGNLTKIGPGSLTLGGVNTYTGQTVVLGGVLIAGSATGFSQASAFTVNTPGVLDVNGFNTSIGSLAGNGTVTNNGARLGSLTTGFDNTSTAFTGSLQNGAGTLALAKVGGGTFTISNSTYTGTTTVTGGTLRAGSTNGFSPNSAFTVNAPGIADLNGFNNTIGSLAGSGTFTNNGAAPAVLTTGQDGASTAFTGFLQNGNSTFALAKVGGGIFTVSNSAYSGATNVNAGTLRAGSTAGFTASSAYTVAGGGILDVNGFDNSIGSLAGAGIVTNNGAAAATLTTGFDSTSTAFTGTLQDGSAALALTKTGPGILTVSNSTYSGATNVIQGTLRAGSTSGFSPRSAFIVSAPGIVDINGFDNSVGSLAGDGTVTNNGTRQAALTTGQDNTDTTFSGSLQDGTSPFALTKTGSGNMTLASANTFTGGTILNGGALSIANSQALGQGNVSVTGGTLQSSGPNNLIQVGGNYTQTANGNLSLRIGGALPGNFDRLAVVGKATLGGRLTLTATNGFAPKVGSAPITIITAGGGVAGTFSTVGGSLTTDPLVKITTEYLANSVVLDFGQGSFVAAFQFSDFALTPNQRAVAFALDNLQTNGRAERLLSYLDAQPLKKLPAAFDRIAPEEYGTIYEISRSAAKMTAVSVENRLDQIHASAPFGPPATGPAGPSGPSDGKGSKEILPPADYRLGVFANGSGEFVSVGNSFNAAGYNFDSGGVTFGVDYKFTDHFVAGVLFNYTRSRADLTEGGRLDVDAFRGGAYASLFGGGAYVNGYVGGGYNDYEMRRTGLDSAVRGETNGGEFNALIATGYDAHVGNFTVGPVASFQYVYTGLSSLDETGSLAPLHINSGKGDSLRTNIGARATYDWHIGSYILTPEVRATYQHEYGDTFEQTTASLLARSPNFTVTNSPIGRDSLILNAGFTLTISPQLAAYAFYDGELARSNYEANNFLVGVRYSF